MFESETWEADEQTNALAHSLFAEPWPKIKRKKRKQDGDEPKGGPQRKKVHLGDTAQNDAQTPSTKKKQSEKGLAASCTKSDNVKKKPQRNKYKHLARRNGTTDGAADGGGGQEFVATDTVGVSLNESVERGSHSVEETTKVLYGEGKNSRTENIKLGKKLKRVPVVENKGEKNPALSAEVECDIVTKRKHSKGSRKVVQEAGIEIPAKSKKDKKKGRELITKQKRRPETGKQEGSMPPSSPVSNGGDRDKTSGSCAEKKTGGSAVGKRKKKQSGRDRNKYRHLVLAKQTDTTAAAGVGDGMHIGSPSGPGSSSMDHQGLVLETGSKDKSKGGESLAANKGQTVVRIDSAALGQVLSKPTKRKKHKVKNSAENDNKGTIMLSKKRSSNTTTSSSNSKNKLIKLKGEKVSTIGSLGDSEHKKMKKKKKPIIAAVKLMENRKTNNVKSPAVSTSPAFHVAFDLKKLKNILRVASSSPPVPNTHKPVQTRQSPGQAQEAQSTCSTASEATPAKVCKKPLSLRERMLEQLQSARFRYLNEQLYTCTGDEAVRLFRKDADAFKVYHEGFQNQVFKWPSNPVDRMIAYLNNKPQSLVVADFGCGDAKIARTVGNKVHSFDLVALNGRVTPCNMADVPLADSSVDVAVFCLSLMGTNLADFLAEANRVLKMGGVLLVAEVISRFEKLGSFVRKLDKMGFHLVEKDSTNQMFVWFEFTKTGSPPSLEKRPAVELAPCVYKKR